MWNYLYLGVCLLFSLLLVFFIKNKSRIKTKENDLFELSMYLCVFSVAVELSLQFITLNLGAEHIITTIFNKIYLISIIIWFVIFSKYIFYIFKPDGKTQNFAIENEKFQKRYAIINVIHNFLAIIFCIAIYFLPIKYYIDGTLMYSYGPAVNFLKLALGIFMASWFVISLKNIKRIANIKYLPILVAFILLILNIVIQHYEPTILIVSFTFTFLSYILYHTIENPDIKMMEELSKNKKIIESQNEDTTNFLFRLTQDIKKPIKDLIEESRKTNVMDSRYINNKARELDYIVNEVLDVSGMSTSSLKIYENKYDFRNLLKEVRIKTENELPKEIKLDYYVSRNVPKELYGDSIVLKKILVSLLDNAIKHTKEGYISIEADAIVKYDIARVMISVSDTGDGMGLDKINDILSHEISEEQYKIDGEKGIFNLNDVKHLMPSLDGSMIIKSENNKGATVSITINQKIVPTEEREVAKKLELYEESLNSGKKIMVVDDDANELSQIKKIIKMKGNYCSTSLYGREIVEKVIRHHKYDIIILDDETDTDRAYVIFHELKKIKGFDTPVIIMIDDNKEFIKLHFLKEGFADVIMKSKLPSEIERVLDKKY